MVFNATFNNISVISWCSVLLVEETRAPKENYFPFLLSLMKIRYIFLIMTFVQNLNVVATCAFFVCYKIILWFFTRLKICILLVNYTKRCNPCLLITLEKRVKIFNFIVKSGMWKMNITIYDCDNIYPQLPNCNRGGHGGDRGFTTTCTICADHH
jgi:hypothetical protein